MEGDKLIQSYPWLNWNLFYRISQNTSNANIIDNIRGKEICAYNDGWLVLKEAKIYCLMNIHSLKKVRLPSVSHNYSRCLLTCSPNDSACLVLFMANERVLCCRPGDRKFKTYNLNKGMHILPGEIVLVEGKVYYRIKDSHDLGVIDCCGSSLQLTTICSLPIPFYSEERVSNWYLVERGGELLMVSKGYYPLFFQQKEVYGFVVQRFDFSNKKWMKVENIGKYTIFLPSKEGHRHGISFCTIEPQIKQNCIYFLEESDEYIHVYDLENHSLSLLSNGLGMLTSYIQEELNKNLYYECQNTKFLPQFPSELSKSVFARVFTLDPGALGALRSVCKDWRSTVRPPISDIDLRYNKYPYLVTLVNGACKFFHPTYNHTFCLDTPELLGAHIKFSKFGWLLLSRFNREIDMVEYFFFCPFTKQTIKLPDGEDEFRTMSFSSLPTSSDCFVVGVSWNGCDLAIIRCGEDQWSILEEDYPFSQRIVNYHPVFYKQKCYCFSANNKLIVIDLNTRKILVVGKTFSTELVDLNECFLIEDEEGLLGAFLLNGKKIPHLMRMDLSQAKKMWQPVQNLDNKMIYVSPAASWSNKAPTKSTGNKIYFPLFQNSSNIFYSLSTGKYHSFGGNFNCCDTPLEVQKITNCAWIHVE